MSKNVYEFNYNQLDGKEVSLSKFKGKVILIVNTASFCGLTYHYTGLEELYQKYKERGLVIIGFPCNQFAGQEPESNASMVESCQINHGVTFQLTEKINVNGPQTHPVFDFLKKEKGGYLISTIKWNFTKFLLDKHGSVVKRYSPTTTPDKIKADIIALI